jgi:sigma-B regulation protein RsbQ
MTSYAADASPGAIARRHAVRVVGADTGGVPVLLAHGFGTDQQMWGRMVPLLAPERPVVLMDHVGAGASDLAAYDAASHRSLRGYAGDLVALLDELGLGPLHYAGHSAGGMIGVLAAVDRPDLFASLTLIGASPRYLDDGDYVGGFTRAAVDELLEAMEANYLGWAGSLAPYAMGNPDRPELAEELAAAFARTRAAVAVDFARAIFLSDFRDVLPLVRTPTLVVQAGADPMVPAEVGRYLAQQIPGARLTALEATGHFPHVSGPEETAGVLRAFLAGIARP